MTMGGDAGAGAAAAQMGMGFGLAQDMVKGLAAQNAAPAAAAPALDVLTPEQAAQILGVSVEDVMAAIAAGDLKARRIGSATRIAKTALEEFLRG
jgi:excisionase family DNA binding protein